MRIRERAYIAFACLFFVVNNSLAQSYHYTNEEMRQKEQEVQVLPASLNTKPGWSIGYLAQPKAGLKKVQIGSKALFASQTQCEVYDFANDTWSSHDLSQPRRNIRGAASEEIACFAGGTIGPITAQVYVSRVDIYSYPANAWFTAKLSEARITGAAIAMGNKVFFAGGKKAAGYSARVDIFEATRRKSRTCTLSEARDSISAVAAGNKIVFAGGETGNFNIPVSSNKVDIYEAHSGAWYTAELSEKRQNMAVAAVAGKAIFAGGLIKTARGLELSRTVDIYDAQMDTWTRATLPEAKYHMAVAVAGSKVYFAGGITSIDGRLSNRVEIYDADANTWSSATLSAPCAMMSTGITSSHIMFGGGHINNLNTISDRIEVLDIASNTWSVEKLTAARCKIAAASYNNRVIFAGGRSENGGEPETSGLIDVWTEPSAENQFQYAINLKNATQISNASIKKAQHTDWLYFDTTQDNFLNADLWRYETKTVKITVVDRYKNVVLNKAVVPFGNTVEQIDISQLPAGLYWVTIESDGTHPIVRSIVLNKKVSTGKIFARL